MEIGMFTGCASPSLGSLCLGPRSNRHRCAYRQGSSPSPWPHPALRYGALTIAEVLPADGKMISCEIDPFLKEFSKPYFAKSPHGHKVDVRLGPALETMRAYDAAAEGGGVDMIFIDADKGGYAAYYEAALSTPGLLADGGVIVVHNTPFKGQASLPMQEEKK